MNIILYQKDQNLTKTRDYNDDDDDDSSGDDGDDNDDDDDDDPPASTDHNGEEITTKIVSLDLSAVYPSFDEENNVLWQNYQPVVPRNETHGNLYDLEQLDLESGEKHPFAPEKGSKCVGCTGAIGKALPIKEEYRKARWICTSIESCYPPGSKEYKEIKKARNEE